LANINRRDFLNVLATAGVGVVAEGASPSRAAGPRIEAIGFDAFTTFNPTSVSTVAESLFPGKGAELIGAWRTRQFEYQWLRALSGHYADFWQVTEDALVFAAKLLKVDLTSQKREELMDALLRIKPWPDSVAALQTLKKLGVRLALLSNVTPKVLQVWIANGGLENIYEHVLTTERIKTFKPDPRAYQMGIDAFGLTREQIAFAAFGGWDAAGAKWFGYRTFWVNRLKLPVEELGVAPDAIGENLNDLVEFVRV
jgi:2-haloacid dehalogenase